MDTFRNNQRQIAFHALETAFRRLDDSQHVDLRISVDSDVIDVAFYEPARPMAAMATSVSAEARPLAAFGIDAQVCIRHGTGFRPEGTVAAITHYRGAGTQYLVEFFENGEAKSTWAEEANIVAAMGKKGDTGPAIARTDPAS